MLIKKFAILLFALLVVQSTHAACLTKNPSIHTKIMKKLFLCSSFADVASLLPELSIPLKGKTIAFIPTASIHEDYTQYVEDGKEALCSLGLIVKELEITRHTTHEIAAVLESCDYIYVSGGNTFFLLQELKSKGADKIILEQINKGKLYVGESAGAMIVSSEIEYVQEMDNCSSQTPHFRDFKALGVVDFYLVPHYKSFPFEEATQLIVQKYNKLALKPITNEQAIVVFGDSVEVLQKK